MSCPNHFDSSFAPSPLSEGSLDSSDSSIVLSPSSGQYEHYLNVFQSPTANNISSTTRGRGSLPGSPLKNLRHQIRGWTYFKEGVSSESYEREVVEESDLVTTLKTYLREITSMTTCVTVQGRRSKCDCLHILSEFDDEAVSACSWNDTT